MERNHAAFPTGLDNFGKGAAPSQGMTMRQYYKAAALQGLISRVPITDESGPLISEDGAANMAGRFADAMLAEDEEHAKRAPQ